MTHVTHREANFVTKTKVRNYDICYNEAPKVRDYEACVRVLNKTH